MVLKARREWRFERATEFSFTFCVSVPSAIHDAGDRAAKEIFTTNMTHNYAAQPDTIHDILNDIDKD